MKSSRIVSIISLALIIIAIGYLYTLSKNSRLTTDTSLESRILGMEITVPEYDVTATLDETITDQPTDSYARPSGAFTSDDDVVSGTVTARIEHINQFSEDMFVMPFTVDARGSGTFLYLGLFQRESDTIRHTDSQFIGDRVVIDEILSEQLKGELIDSFIDYRITVEYHKHGSTQGMSETPAEPAKMQIDVRGDAFQNVAEVMINFEGEVDTTHIITQVFSEASAIDSEEATPAEEITRTTKVADLLATDHAYMQVYGELQETYAFDQEHMDHVWNALLVGTTIGDWVDTLNAILRIPTTVDWFAFSSSDGEGHGPDPFGLESSQSVAWQLVRSTEIFQEGGENLEVTEVTPGSCLSCYTFTMKFEHSTEPNTRYRAMVNVVADIPRLVGNIQKK